MKRTALAAVLLLVVTACGTPDVSATTTTVADGESGFPVTVTDDRGEVTIEERPESVISLSPTATEMLFAVGAGDQVIAVDDQSNYPPEAPSTELSGFTPNLEAIIAYRPDLVVIAFDPADDPISQGLEEVGVPVLFLDAAVTLEDVYRQIEVIGTATGNPEMAQQVNEAIRTEIDEIVAESGGVGEGVTYFHELDNNLFTVTSATFTGQIYALLGMENIADPADEGGFGYPQLSPEFVVSADPEIIFLADAAYGESAETLAQRPGWAGMTALERGAVVEVDPDLASRWGPRVVDFLRLVAAAVEEHVR